jgi:Glycosyltransferase family 87
MKLDWKSGVGLLCLMILIAGLYRQVSPQPYQAPDFHNTYRASTALREGTNVYEHALTWVDGYKRGDKLTDQYFYAPTYAMLLIPLTYLPYQAAIAVWGTCLATFLCVAIYALFRAVGQRPPLWQVLLIAAAASIMSAVRAEYFLGQANLFMLACMCTAIWARQAQRPLLAGALLALALVTKPMLLLIAGFLLWKREFKFAFATIGGFAFLLLAPFIYLGTQAFGHLLKLWRFYGTQYLSFSENITPRGMLERLFTVNPFVEPLTEAPGVAVGVWLILFVLVLFILLAVVAPRPIIPEPASLVEFGAILSGLMVVSPLTEPPYLVLLILPMTAALIYLRSVRWRELPALSGTLGLTAVWFAELVPRSLIEPHIWANLDGTDPLQTVLLVLLAPTHFYILLGTFALQLYVLRLASGHKTSESMSHLVKNGPMLVVDCFKELFAVRRFS